MTSDENTTKILERISAIDTTLAVQQEILAEHIRRTELLEGQMIPVRELMDQMVGAIRFIQFVGVCCAIAECVHIFVR